uniref:Uncharacterized protein n=1 Tax=Lepeophtheirus salmonis TaxID=72036 RepID=A0A0K2UN95_LEPSM
MTWDSIDKQQFPDPQDQLSQAFVQRITIIGLNTNDPHCVDFTLFEHMAKCSSLMYTNLS